MSNGFEWQKNAVNLINRANIKVVDIDLAKNQISYSDKIKQYRNIRIISGDEELVRATLINYLVNELDYKIDLFEIEKEYNIGRPKTKKARIDLILRDVDGKPFFFVEVKAPDKFESDKEFIEDQLYKLAKLEGNVKYLVYYSLDFVGTDIIDRAIIIDYEKYPEYDDWVKAGMPSIGEELTPGYNKPQKPPLIKGDMKHDLRTNINRNEIIGLTNNLHNVLWGGGGTTDTEIFYSLVNIILSKIQDESEKETGQKYDFQIYMYGDSSESPEKVFDRINELYRRALKNKLNISEERRLDKSYVVHEEKFPINKLIYAVQTLEKYSFLEGRSSLDGRDILGDFFETITRDGFKQTKGQFFTPTNIVKFILYGLKIDELAITKLNKETELPFIIDPSCGSGTFLIEAMKLITKEIKYKQIDKISSSRQVQDRYNELFLPDNKENHWAKEYIYGADINFDLGTAAKVNMILHGDGSANIFVKDGLLPFRFYDKDVAPNYLKIYEDDSHYYDKEVNSSFDVVISNPPFSVDLDSETKRYLNNSFLFGGKKNSENLFIERWYQLLRENGRLGVVLPENVFDTTENKYIRLFLFKYFNIKAIISLPKLTFEPYTSTKTSLLFAQKKRKSDVEEWNRLWDNFGNEWSKLKTKIENYYKVYIEGKKKSRYPSIKNESESEIKENIINFLKDHVVSLNSDLSVKELLLKYKDELEDLCKYDKSLTDTFGFYNAWWVFSKVSKVASSLDYEIFMAEAENVGYKRTKKGENPAPNDLFDTEIAPLSIDKKKILLKYKIELEELNKSLEAIKDKKSKNSSIKITKMNEKIQILEIEKKEFEDLIKKYYDSNGIIKEEYKDRTDSYLKNFFSKGLINKFKSNDVVLRENKTEKILDFLREQIIWD